MRLKACLLIFDGLADWEPALALCEIKKSGKFEIATVGFSAEPVTSMDGLRIIPDLTLDAVDPEQTAVFIMPGGEMWEQGPQARTIELLDRLHTRGTIIAAICGATLEVVRAGLTHGLHHTSNSKGYLKAMLPEYRDEDHYVDRQAVSDRNIITASGLGSVEFACEILGGLHIHNGEELQELHPMFKHGVIPARYVI
ncbi:MAG: DJ-1/PfpI family protein [Syntrophaceae bacterium]